MDEFDKFGALGLFLIGSGQLKKGFGLDCGLLIKRLSKGLGYFQMGWAWLFLFLVLFFDGRWAWLLIKKKEPHSA